MQENKKPEDGRKLKFLKEIEKTETKLVIRGTPLLITFPYPYMNGKLHLGHLFSFSKAEFFSRFAELNGYNALFPFSFHCTGMPISASAKRLEDGDEKIQEIIQSFGFKNTEPFKNPEHWIKTFPGLAMNSLKKINSNITWNRSFVTTDINKIYDSFIKWQFKKLEKLGLLSFGKRYSIFCRKNLQPCLDHDRLVGEGVLPIKSDLFILKIPVFDKYIDINFGVPFNFKTGDLILYINEAETFVLFSYSESFYLVNEECFENLKYQISDITQYCKIEGLKLFDLQFIYHKTPIVTQKRNFTILTNIENNTTDYRILANLAEQEKELDVQVENKISYTINKTADLIRYFKPEKQVISRSNSICVVGLLEQWFLDYNNLDWKKRAFNCLEKLDSTPETKNHLKDGLDWIHKWGFSRNFGLGTTLPWLKNCLIDSLSDSTIYMSLYTYYHHLSNDLFGDTEFEQYLTEEFFDYIYQDLLIEKPELKNDFDPRIKEVLDNCKNDLNTFYPVYLRVSGKDLTRNHLIFYIFNHVALFKEQFWPKRIETNGYLLLNSQKMSKSTGNFLTVDDVIDKYGVNATRLCLAMCGDSNEDADFLEQLANANILKLFSFLELVQNYFENKIDFENQLSFEEKYLEEIISKNCYETYISYRNFLFRDVVKFGFHEMLNAYEYFISLGGDKYSKVVYQLIETMVLILYPIIPSISIYLNEKYFKKQFEWPKLQCKNQFINSIEHLKKIHKLITKRNKKKNFKRVKIGVNNKYSPWQDKIILYLNMFVTENSVDYDKFLDRIVKPSYTLTDEIKSELIKIFQLYNIDLNTGMRFACNYLVKHDNYRLEFDEYELLFDNRFRIEELTGLVVEIVWDENAEPLEPTFKFEVD